MGRNDDITFIQSFFLYEKKALIILYFGYDNDQILSEKTYFMSQYE